jgi:hypothetical protein
MVVATRPSLVVENHTLGRWRDRHQCSYLADTRTQGQPGVMLPVDQNRGHGAILDPTSIINWLTWPSRPALSHRSREGSSELLEAPIRRALLALW